MGPDRDIWWVGVYRRLPPCLIGFKAAVDLDVRLREFRTQGEGGPRYPLRTMDRATSGSRKAATSTTMPGTVETVRRPTFRYFHCNQVDHHMADYTLPPAKTPELSTSNTREKAGSSFRLFRNE